MRIFSRKIELESSRGLEAFQGGACLEKARGGRRQRCHQSKHRFLSPGRHLRG
jgi:hypothetical protein